MKRKKDTNLINKNNNLSVLCLVILIVLFLEIFLFNFRFFQSLGYTPVPLTNALMDTSIIQTGNSVFKFNSNNAKIQFNDIDTEVKNIYIDMDGTKPLSNMPTYNEKKQFEENKLVKVKITIDDKSSSKGIEMPERSLVSTVEKTKYIPLYLDGESQKLTLEFINTEGREFKINSITLNKNVPFSFNIIRVLVILIVIALIYVMRPGSKFYNYKLNFRKSKQKALIISIVILQILGMGAGSFINPVYVYNTISHQEQYNTLAEALLDGHFYLNETPDPKLQTLENPYDPSARDEAGAVGRWDHAYYEGKYYVYFGIVPALLFNVPSLLFSGERLTPFSCILILIPIFIVMSYLLIYALAKKFTVKENESIPLLLYIMLTTLFINGTGTAFLMVWPDMYTLPIFTALTLAVSGLYFWLTAFKYKNSAYSFNNIKLFLGSLFIALIAGSRPQMLLIIFASIPIFKSAVFNDRKLFSKNSIASTLCFTVPIIVFAAFMFYYNYARFGSIFDFGANYNLTTNDMTARGIKFARIPQGIFSYFFQPVSLKGTFPYITTADFATKYMGITISEVLYGGIFFLQPVIWMLLILPKVKNQLKEKNLYALSILFIIFAFIIASADSIMAGILSRYFMDFSWLLILASIIVIFAAYNKYKNRDYWKIFNYCFPICFAISMLITFGITIGGNYYTPADTNPEVFWKIASTIQFWL